MPVTFRFGSLTFFSPTARASTGESLLFFSGMSPSIGQISRGPGLSISATEVSFDDHTMWVVLDDGRTIGVPLAWFPRLLQGTLEQRQAVEISASGLHWEALDEDISLAGLLAGRGDQTIRRPSVA